MGLLLGSLIGIQIGALTTKVVSGSTIKSFWVTTILAGFINRLTVIPKQFNDLGIINIPKSVAQNIETAGFFIFWIIIAIFVFWVVMSFFKNIKTFREG